MSVLDLTIIIGYFLAITAITWQSLRSHKDERLGSNERRRAEAHFLASRDASLPEAVFSIVATEFSAVTFIQLPALVLLGTRGIAWGLVGILLGRWVISRFLLLNFYRSGLTVFEALARGRKGYAVVSPSTARSQRLLAVLYFFTKVLSVAAAMFLGVSFIGQFLAVDYRILLTVIVLLTSTYTMVGGLRAVMRTDILQFFLITLSGLILLVLGFSQLETAQLAQIDVLRLAGFDAAVLKGLAIGVTVGFISDFITHGVEQDFVQKLKACRSVNIAFRAVFWSTWLSLGLQLIFILIGVSFLLAIPTEGLNLSQVMQRFMDHTVGLVGPGARGVVVVGILAATMSTLDSSINALSAVLWNDILPGDKISRYPILIKVDNAVVTFFVLIFAFFVGQHPNVIHTFLNLNTVVLLPIACCFILRFVLYRYLRFDFSLFSLVLLGLGCFTGFVLNSIFFEFPLQFAIIMCLGMSGGFLWFYNRLKEWI